MTGNIAIGFEYGAELTYPEPDATTSGLLNASAQLSGASFILIQEVLLTR